MLDGLARLALRGPYLALHLPLAVRQWLKSKIKKNCVFCIMYIDFALEQMKIRRKKASRKQTNDDKRQPQAITCYMVPYCSTSSSHKKKKKKKGYSRKCVMKPAAPFIGTATFPGDISFGLKNWGGALHAGCFLTHVVSAHLSFNVKHSCLSQCRFCYVSG